MMDTKPLICKVFNTDDSIYQFRRQKDSEYKYKIHRCVGKDDIQYLALRWYFITNRIKRHNEGKARFSNEDIARYKEEMREIKGMLLLSRVPDDIINLEYIKKNVKPFCELVKMDIGETGMPNIIKVTYEEFLKEFYY